MEALIRQAFENVDVIGPQVMQGTYDLISNEQIVLPQIWEKVVDNLSLVRMQMWPRNSDGSLRKW
jgi:hypothetical protein